MTGHFQDPWYGSVQPICRDDMIDMLDAEFNDMTLTR